MSLVQCKPATLDCRCGTTGYIHLMSDLHIGAAAFDEALVLRELAAATTHVGLDRDGVETAVDSRLAIAGDIFDAITHTDHRYTPDAVDPRFHGVAELSNAALEYAEDLLGPYAHLIDMVGVGNHETKLVKRGGFDPVRALVRNLNKTHGTKIQYGGIGGYLPYRVRVNDTRSRPLSIGYHHGNGKGGGLAGAARQLTAIAGWLPADVVWAGHIHVRWAGEMVAARPASGITEGDGEDGGNPQRRTLLIQTSSYLNSHAFQPSGKALRGRRSNYAVDWALPPGSLGGVTLQVTPTDRGLDVRAIL